VRARLRGRILLGMVVRQIQERLFPVREVVELAAFFPCNTTTIMGREDGIDAGDQLAVGDDDLTDTEALLWDRVVRFRSAQCDDLPYSVVRSLLQEFQIALNSNEETVQDFLKRHVAISTDPFANLAERRRSFTRVQSLLARIVREKKKLGKQNNTAAGARKSVVVAVGDAVSDGSNPTAVQLYVDPNGDSERMGVFRAPMEGPTAVVAQFHSRDQDDEDIGGEALSRTAGERGVMVAGGRVARNEANSATLETPSLTAPLVQEVDDNIINKRSTSSLFVPASSLNTPSIAAIGQDLVPTPRPNDVLVGRRNEYMDHPGNVQCRKWIYELATQEYSQSPTREERIGALRTTIVKVYAAGGRFLERENSTSSIWRKVDEKSILDLLDHESQQLPQERQQLRTETNHGLASQTSSGSSAARLQANNYEPIPPRVPLPQLANGSDQRFATIISQSQVTEHDVLFGRLHSKWPGNMFCRQQYHLAKEQNRLSVDRIEIVKATIQTVLRNGGRFLRQIRASDVGALWMEVDPRQVCILWSLLL